MDRQPTLHHQVRRVDRQGEVTIWCKKCPGFTRQRKGPKLMTCCKPVQVGTKEHGKMLKRIRVLEDGRVPAKEVENWRIEAKKRRISRKEYRRLFNEFELEGLVAQKGLWNLAKEERLQYRGALLREERDVIREYTAMHDENFLSSWLREDLVGKEERRKEDKKLREEVEKKEKREEEQKREGEKEENEIVRVKRYIDSFSADAFDIFSQGTALQKKNDAAHATAKLVSVN